MWKAQILLYGTINGLYIKYYFSYNILTFYLLGLEPRPTKIEILNQPVNYSQVNIHQHEV